MFLLPIEILQQIMDISDYLLQIRLNAICSKFRTLKITNMYVSNIIATKLSENILQRHMFIKKLNLYDNTIINDISYLKHITYLNVSGCCVIDQAQIDKQIELQTLIMNNNPHIINLGYLTKLENLSVKGCCNITAAEINKISTLRNLKIELNCDLDKKSLFLLCK